MPIAAAVPNHRKRSGLTAPSRAYAIGYFAKIALPRLNLVDRLFRPHPLLHDIVLRDAERVVGVALSAWRRVPVRGSLRG